MSVSCRYFFPELVDDRCRDLVRAPIQPQNAETVPSLGEQWLVGCLFHELADRPTQRQAVTRGVGFHDLHGVVLEVQRGSWHGDIMSSG
jgi:hypothetical protein